MEKQQETNYKKFKKEFIEKRINLRKDFYKNKESFEKSSLFEYFRRMPKGVLNHVHFPAFNTLDDWMSILKQDECVKDLEKGVYLVRPRGDPLEAGLRRYGSRGPKT